MGSAVAQMKYEWRAFKGDEPGKRFRQHHDRMQHRSTLFRTVTLVLGIVLLAAGLVLCFIPGPGTPLIVFGLAMIGARWRWLARQLDKAEVALRRNYRHAKAWLKRRRQHSY
jgi:hypothetical protein